MTEPSRIAETFAPVVWLHKDDEYRPSSVDWYLATASLEYNNKRTIIEEGKITGAALISQTVESDHLDVAKAPYNRNQKFNLKIKNEPSIMKGDLNTADVMCTFGQIRESLYPILVFLSL